MSSNGTVGRGGEAAPPPQSRSGKLLRRSNSDRLRMHAPSSIQVAAPAAAAGEWKQAIPLLSPLDLELTPWHRPPEPARAESVAAQSALPPPPPPLPAKWEHPAAPFYYEPVPSNAAPFVSSHCT